MYIYFAQFDSDYKYTHVLNTRVDTAERSSIDKYRRIDDKISHLISHLMKQFLVAGAVITKNQYGKPLSENIFFNVSHDSHVVVGISHPGRRVGIDVMKLHRKDINLAHFKSSFVIREWDIIEWDIIDNQYMFLKHWCYKEAFLKMKGCGFSIPANHVEMVFDPNDQNDIKVYLNGKLQNCFIKFIEHEGYGIAVCLDEIKHVDIEINKMVF